jgi:hypothetical protein
VSQMKASPTPPDSASPPAEAPGAKPDRMGLLWRVLGGMLGAAIVFTAVTVYQQMQAQLALLRSELAGLNKETRRELASMGEKQGALTKRADHEARVRLIWDSLKELRNDRSDLGRLKERCGLLLDLYKAGEEERRQLLADVRRLSERKSGGDSQALARELRALRERIAQLEGGPKIEVTTTGHAEGTERP